MPPRVCATPTRRGDYNSDVNGQTESQELFPEVAQEARAGGGSPAYMPGTPGNAPHCPQCDYNLFGLEKLRCPECGFELDDVALVRGRRLANDPTANRRIVNLQNAILWAGLVGFAIATPSVLLLGRVFAAVFSLIFAAGVGVFMAAWASSGRSLYPVLGISGILYFALCVLFLALRFF